MFNTSALFKLKEMKETEERLRLNLRIMHMLHARLEKLDVVKQLEEKMKAGERPSVPFLSYQRGSAWSDGDENLDLFGKKVLVFEEFRPWLHDSPHRMREHGGYLEDNNIHSIAYLFDTVLADMDFPELPLLYKHGRYDCGLAPARKLFTKGGGALVMLEAILGNGLQVKETREHIDSKTISRKWLDDYGEETIQSQTISVSRVTWSIEFTGRPARPWAPVPATQLDPASSIARALAQLNEVTPKMKGFAFCWPRLLTPYWKNPDMSIAIVKHMEEGKDLTDAQSREMTLAREERERIDPGEAEAEEGRISFCHNSECRGVLGAGGFCRTCSKKFISEDGRCAMEDVPHNMYHVLSKNGTYGAIDCQCCGYMLRWSVPK